MKNPITAHHHEKPAVDHVVQVNVGFLVSVPKGSRLVRTRDGSLSRIILPNGKMVKPNAAVEIGDDNVLWKDADLREHGIVMLDYVDQDTNVSSDEEIPVIDLETAELAAAGKQGRKVWGLSWDGEQWDIGYTWETALPECGVFSIFARAGTKEDAILIRDALMAKHGGISEDQLADE